MRCAACGKPLGGAHHVFAFQDHQIAYTREGNTPSEQALLQPGACTTIARFCSSACCKPHLGHLLSAQSLPAQYQHNRVSGGPIVACGKCGKPVNLTQPHGAWIKGKVTADIQNAEEAALDWLDVLAVLCAGCSGAQSSISMNIGRMKAISGTPGTPVHASIESQCLPQG